MPKACQPKLQTLTYALPGLFGDRHTRAIVLGGLVEGWLRGNGAVPEVNWRRLSFPACGHDGQACECPPADRLAARWFARRVPDGLDVFQLNAMCVVVRDRGAAGFPPDRLENLALSYGEEWASSGAGLNPPGWPGPATPRGRPWPAVKTPDHAATRQPPLSGSPGGFPPPRRPAPRGRVLSRFRNARPWLVASVRAGQRP